MRHYKISTSSKKSRRRRSWSSSKFGPEKFRRIRQHEEAAFLGYSNTLYKNSKTRPVHAKSLILFLLTASWVGFLFYSPYFRITETSYSGYKLTSLDQIKSLIDQSMSKKGILVPSNHYFLVNTANLENILENNLPIDSVKVTKIFPKSLTVAIVEKNSSIVFDNGESYFLMDKDGKMLKFLKQITLSYTTSTALNATSTTTTPTLIPHRPNRKDFDLENNNLPIYFDSSFKTVDEGNNILEPKLIESINEFDRGIRKGNGIKVEFYTPDFTDTDIIAVTNLGWKIKFTTERSIDNQLTALWSMFKSATPNEYIDVRLEDRLFWK